MKLIFLPDCTRAVIDGRVSTQMLDAIDRALTYAEPGAFFTPQYKRGLWDGKRHLFKRKDQTFPVGLAQRVLALLQALDADPEIDDQRPTIDMPEPVTTLHGFRENEPPTINLFDDQREALTAFFAEPHGCLELPTSHGKTELAAAIFATLRDQPGLMIVDRKGLLSQTAERLEGRLKEKVGRYGDRYKDTDRRVTVATIQSLWHHYDRMVKTFFPRQKIVIVDECHSISPNMWFQTLEVIPAPIRLGLSATITEAKRRMVVESYLGPIVHRQDLIELIELDRVAVPNVSMLRVGGLFDDAMDPVGAYWHGIVQHRQRNEYIIDATQRAETQKKPVLILCVRIEHGRILERMFEKIGWSVPFLYGHTPLDVIDRAKRDLERGQLPAMIASTIFDKGQDMPSVRAAILAGAQRSSLLTIQRLGRGLRKKPSGENTLDALDFMDMGHRNLRSQANDRRKTYERKNLHPRVIGSLDEWL